LTRNLRVNAVVIFIETVEQVCPCRSGASSTVIKNHRPEQPVPPLTLNQGEYLTDEGKVWQSGRGREEHSDGFTGWEHYDLIYLYFLAPSSNIFQPWHAKLCVWTPDFAVINILLHL